MKIYIAGGGLLGRRYEVVLQQHIRYRLLSYFHCKPGGMFKDILRAYQKEKS